MTRYCFPVCSSHFLSPYLSFRNLDHWGLAAQLPAARAHPCILCRPITLGLLLTLPHQAQCSPTPAHPCLVLSQQGPQALASLTDDHGEDPSRLLACDLFVELRVIELQALQEGHVALVTCSLQDVQEYACNQRCQKGLLRGGTLALLPSNAVHPGL